MNIRKENKMRKLIALYRDAVRDDWARPTDATFANMQEAKENILSVIDKLEKENKQLKEALVGQKAVKAMDEMICLYNDPKRTSEEELDFFEFVVERYLEAIK